MLSFELPPPPLFRDAFERTIIPQVTLFSLLRKFDGTTLTVRMLLSGPVAVATYCLLTCGGRAGDLVASAGRAVQRRYRGEKEVRNTPTSAILDPPLQEICQDFASARKESDDCEFPGPRIGHVSLFVVHFSSSEVSFLMPVDAHGVRTKTPSVASCPDVSGATERQLYNLVASISHQTLSEVQRQLHGKEGKYVVYALHRPTSTWYEMDDLDVREKLPQDVASSEAYVQIYERQQSQ